jgi:hypothetical protein
MDNVCPHCNKPVPPNELHSFHMHEDCWINMLLHHRCIDDTMKGRPRIKMEKSMSKWMQIMEAPN